MGGSTQKSTRQTATSFTRVVTICYFGVGLKFGPGMGSTSDGRRHRRQRRGGPGAADRRRRQNVSILPENPEIQALFFYLVRSITSPQKLGILVDKGALSTTISGTVFTRRKHGKYLTDGIILMQTIRNSLKQSKVHIFSSHITQK